ncbi:WXG100 family type VII secretion target [Kitasatospora sp. NPDC091335]|uniref:WXG100 family type VII secretion target n=1 Tax=Kitasatospora sp. NPDC091335 TaxID=3364085 RepID=UPI0038161F39
MVEKTNPAIVLTRGTQLQSAGRVLKELSAALKSHVGNVAWEGPAAESFKTWAGNLQLSAEKLGGYSASAGDAMHQAGEALSTAKAAMPPEPHDALNWVEGRKTQKPDPVVIKQMQLVSIKPDSSPSASEIDAAMRRSVGDKWVTETQAMAGTREIYMAHQEAIHQMEKLAQAYVAATTTLNGLGDGLVLPGTPGASKDRGDASDYSSGGGSTGGSGSSVRVPRTGSSTTGGSYGPTGGNFGGGSVAPRDPGSWQDPSTPVRNSPIPPQGGGQLPPAPQDPNSSIPPSYPSDPVDRPGTGLNSLPTLPTQTGPYGPGGGQLPPDGPTTLPGYPNGPSGQTNGPGVPGGPVPGIPIGPGGGQIQSRGGGGGQVQPRMAPFGGGPGQGKGGTPGLPSGTVFGNREAGPGSGRVGGPNGAGGMHPGMGGAHGGAIGAGAGSRGRGLSSTTGGAVGGRKGPVAGGEFTPGGTGLRNRAASVGESGAQARQSGMMAPGMTGHGGRNERDRRKRADYLHEDEETWTSGTPHGNPDVIE